MKSILIYAMIYLGSALMVWNIYSYIRFAKHMREHGDWQREERILQELGARIEYLPYTQEVSTSMLREALDV